MGYKMTKEVTIDPLIFTLINEKLHILLLKRNFEPFLGNFSLPGGVIEENSDFDLLDSFRKILKKKTNLDVNYSEQLCAFGSKNRDPRSWTLSLSYIALINFKNTNITNTKYGENVWFDISQLNSIIIAFDHKEIILEGLKRLKNKVNYSTLPAYFLDDEFTLPDLQKIYEIILEQKMDKSSFRKKILESDFIEKIDKKEKIGACRPAQLYKIKVGKNETPTNFNSNINKKLKF